MRSLFSYIVFALGLALPVPVAAAPAAAPKLIIVISVDQFASDVYNRYAGSFTGGLKRLSNGIAFPVAYQSHAATETCPGHSTILTGDHPSHTGIIANSWFDRTSGTTLYCVSVAGTGDPAARGPQKLKATTLGDWLKRAHPTSRVVSVSGKDRAAIMLGGHNADLVTWWVDGAGFETSRFAGPANAHNEALLKEENSALMGDWAAAAPALWPTNVPSDCVPEEKAHRFGAVEVTGSVPPQAAVEATATPGFAERSQFQDALHASPLFDSLTLRLAGDIATKWKLGAGSSPDLLAISLSATDYVGHRYGNGGAEMCAQVHALDQSLAKFLDRVDGLGVPYLVVLTADHGSVDAPERLQEKLPAQRVDTAAFLGALNTHLKEALGVPWEPITADDPQQLYIVSPGDQAFLARVRSETLSWLQQQPSVEHVFTREEVLAATPSGGKSPAALTPAERLNESFDPTRSPDIMVEFKKYATLGWPRGPSDYVAGHGSPWDYDREVPILFWWPGAERATLSTPVETVDIAPTIASMIGIAAPPVDGRCLPAIADCADQPRATVSANKR